MAISEIGVSSITLSQFMYGVSKSSKPEQNRMALAQFIAPLEILPYGDVAAQCHGDVRVFLERQGRAIGALDMPIAAHALSVPRTLVTNNTREFVRVPDLKIENWVE